MRLENTMSIPVPAADAWRVLLDIERIAPCVPGATLVARDGDRYQGRVKVRLGPIGLTYNGSVAFVTLDEAARVVVMEAAGREIRGGGTAKATITCRLAERAGATDVLVATDLAITGKPAQFGRGALADVASAIIGQFAANLAAEIAPDGAADGLADAAASGAAATGSVRVAPSAPAAPIDVLQATGSGALGRLGPLAVPGAALLALATAAILARRLDRRRRQG
jgi:carbon monoxide dehydrogenase subunit G